PKTPQHPRIPRPSPRVAPQQPRRLRRAKDVMSARLPLARVIAFPPKHLALKPTAMSRVSAPVKRLLPKRLLSVRCSTVPVKYYVLLRQMRRPGAAAKRLKPPPRKTPAAQTPKSQLPSRRHVLLTPPTVVVSRPHVLRSRQRAQIAKAGVLEVVVANVAVGVNKLSNSLKLLSLSLAK